MTYQNVFLHRDTNEEELEIKVIFSVLCQGMVKVVVVVGAATVYLHRIQNKISKTTISVSKNTRSTMPH